MKSEEFERLVDEVIGDFPEWVKEKLKNVVVLIEDDSTEKNILGLYEGIPESEWEREFNGKLPDKITLYKNTIENNCKNTEEVRNTIKMTVYHEIAHHLGFSEKEVEKLEKDYYERNRNN